MITIDSRRRVLHLDVAEEEILGRKKAWVQPAPKYTSGVLAKYARLVSSSSIGAVTD
jgi:dihydroxy-acid dehydratase